MDSMQYTSGTVVMAAVLVAVLSSTDVGQLPFVMGGAVFLVLGVFVVEAISNVGAGSSDENQEAEVDTKSDPSVISTAAPAMAEDAAPLATPVDLAAICVEVPLTPAPPSMDVGCLPCFTGVWQKRRRSAKEGLSLQSDIQNSEQLCHLNNSDSNVKHSPKASARALASCPEVQMLCDSGRVLEAQRLLDARARGNPPQLDADIPALQRVVAATKQFVYEAGAGECWKRTELPGGQLLYNYNKTTCDVEFMATLALDVSPLKLWAFFREFDLSPLWIPNNEFSNPICDLTGSRQLYHFRAKPMIRYVMSGTEAFQERNFVDGLDGPEGFLLSVGFAIPGEATTYEGVDLPLPAPGYKRFTTEARDMVRPEYREGELKSVLTVHRKLKIPFTPPDWAVSWVAGTAVVSQMSSLQRTWEAWEGSEHEQRVQQGPRAEYYASLQSRLESVAKAKLEQQ